MPRTDALQQAFATTTCRHRLLRLLDNVDELGEVVPDRVMQMVDSSGCRAGHELHYAALQPLLTADDGGSLRLSTQGAALLLDAGRPSPDWEASIAVGAPPLRKWQSQALRSWCDHGRHGVVEAVTGTGKSRVGIEATREALSDDYNVVIMVPSVELVTQWVRSLKQSNVPSVGALGDGKRANFATHRVIVGTVQSLYANPLTRPDGKVLLVADECHRYGAGQWSRALHPSYRRRLGLTATFERNDDGIKQLLDYFGGGPVYQIGFKAAIAAGVVAPYDVKLVGVALNSAERREYDRADENVRETRLQLMAADFPTEPFGAFLHEVQKAAEDDPDPTISDLARRYLKAFSERIDIMTNAQEKLDAASLLAPEINQSHGTILFTRRVDMAEEIAQTLVENGVKAAAVHSETPRAERQSLLSYLKIGRLKALVAPTILDEGLDVPDVDLGVVMGGSRSRRQMIQRMGRVLRLKDDGRKATFIVVYAEDTAEDITRTDGAEGCLDLIVESADTVTRLISHGDGLRPDTEAVTPLQRAAPVLPDRSAMLLEEESGRPTEVSLSEVIAGINPSTFPMTRRVLDDYATAHGVEVQEAKVELRRMLADFQAVAKIASWPAAGAVALQRDGFELVVTAERIVRYFSYRRDALTWSDLRGEDAEHATPDVPAQPVLPLPAALLKAQRSIGASSESETPISEPVRIPVSSVTIDARVLRDVGVALGESLPHEQVEAKVRQMLGTDLAGDHTIRSNGRLLELSCALRTWTLRADGHVVHQLRQVNMPASRPSDDRVPKQPYGVSTKRTDFNLANLETDPHVLYDLLNPDTVLIGLRAVASAAQALGLGEPESEDALEAVRALLGEDLPEKPDITFALGRVTIHGRRAQWTLRGEELAVTDVNVSTRWRTAATDSERAPDAEGVSGKAPGSPHGPPIPGDRDSGDVDAKTAMRRSDDSDDVPRSTRYAADETASTDLVSQIERLVSLMERGLLTQEEFATAKARILA